MAWKRRPCAPISRRTGRGPAGRPTGEKRRFGPSWKLCPATFEFFEADKATVKLLFRDAYALGDRFEKHLGGIYERFIDDIETFIVAAQERGEVVAGPAPDDRLHAEVHIPATIKQYPPGSGQCDRGPVTGLYADLRSTSTGLMAEGRRLGGTSRTSRSHYEIRDRAWDVSLHDRVARVIADRVGHPGRGRHTSPRSCAARELT